MIVVPLNISVPVWNVLKFITITLILIPLMEVMASKCLTLYGSILVCRGRGVRWRNSRLGIFSLHQLCCNRTTKLSTFATAVVLIAAALLMEFGSDTAAAYKEREVSVVIPIADPIEHVCDDCTVQVTSYSGAVANVVLEGFHTETNSISGQVFSDYHLTEGGQGFVLNEEDSVVFPLEAFLSVESADVVDPRQMFEAMTEGEPGHQVHHERNAGWFLSLEYRANAVCYYASQPLDGDYAPQAFKPQTDICIDFRGGVIWLLPTSEEVKSVGKIQYQTRATLRDPEALILRLHEDKLVQRILFLYLKGLRVAELSSIARIILSSMFADKTYFKEGGGNVTTIANYKTRNGSQATVNMSFVLGVSFLSAVFALLTALWVGLKYTNLKVNRAIEDGSTLLTIAMYICGLTTADIKMIEVRTGPEYVIDLLMSEKNSNGECANPAISNGVVGAIRNHDGSYHITVCEPGKTVVPEARDTFGLSAVSGEFDAIKNMWNSVRTPDSPTQLERIRRRASSYWGRLFPTLFRCLQTTQLSHNKLDPSTTSTKPPFMLFSRMTSSPHNCRLSRRRRYKTGPLRKAK